MLKPAKMMIMMVCLLMITTVPSVSLAKGYTEESVINATAVSRVNVIEPIAERLYELGYHANKITHQAEKQDYFQTRHYAAINLFCQVMDIPYKDGVISVEAQEALFSSTAKECPIAVPGDRKYTYELSQLSNSNADQGKKFWDYAIITDINYSGDVYKIECTSNTVSNAVIKASYDMPDYAPQLLIGDEVFIMGMLVSKKSRIYTVNAELITFSAVK